MPDKECGKRAAFIYTWVPGQTGYICQDHAEQMQSIAFAMGHMPHLDPVDDDECRCEQKVSSHG